MPCILCKGWRREYESGSDKMQFGFMLGKRTTELSLNIKKHVKGVLQQLGEATYSVHVFCKYEESV